MRKHFYITRTVMYKSRRFLSGLFMEMLPRSLAARARDVQGSGDVWE